MTECREPKLVQAVTAGPHDITCQLDDGSSLDLPAFLAKFIRPFDVIRVLSPGGDCFLVERRASQSRSQWLVYSKIGYATQPKQIENGAYLVRAELPADAEGFKILFLSGDSIRSYFYCLGDTEEPTGLYSLLGAPDTATTEDLRVAWRVRQLESGHKTAYLVERSRCERAFNILAHPDLRNSYDALRRDRDAPPVFPYGGFGSILVEGKLSPDGEVFFANRILAYKPEMRSRGVSLLLRQCQFLADRVICRDRRRKLEVMLDSTLLPGLDWDLTWNRWKHWLASRIEVEATFVRTGVYRLRLGDWVLRTWITALPSRLRVSLPDGLAADVERAKAIHALLGEHAKLVEKIRHEVEQQPVEHVQIRDWFDRLGASQHLEPQHVTWRPDYEPYYFEQLRKRSSTWFLFREEYLFVWAGVLISEIPQRGHATYVFAKPEGVRVFLRRYCQATREDIRHNRENIATDLGFVGRVVRGRTMWRWTNEVLKVAGEKADYTEVFE